MIRISGQVGGLQETQAALAQVLPILMDEADAAMRASLFHTTAVAQKNYLSGPRPSRLGVISNRLRGSLSEGSPELIYDVQRQALKIEGKIGTSTIYAPIHEFGGVIRPKKGKYLAIPTTLAKTSAGAVKDQYNRGLREIEGLFLARSKDKRTLFAAIKSPATGRKRRSGFQVLFWLVKQSVVKATPFLNPALRDSQDWINNRFAQGLRRVERRLTTLLRGR